MFNRFFLAPFALAGALLGASVAAFAQSAPPPAQQDQGQPPTQDQGQPPAQQDQGQPPSGAPRHVSKMRAVLASLDLSSDQEAQIRGFMRSYRQSRQTSTPESRKQLLAQIEGVLTPDQQSKFESGMRRRPASPDGQQQQQQPPSDGQAPPPNPQ